MRGLAVRRAGLPGRAAIARATALAVAVAAYGLPSPASSATASASLGLHARVAGRSALELAPRVVTLLPGESTRLRVTAKCRLRAGERLEVRLVADLEPRLAEQVRVSTEGGTRSLAARPAVAILAGSGVAVRWVVLSVAPDAAGPLSLVLDLQAAAAF